MHLLHCLWFFVAYFDIVISAAHLPGRANIIADGLSRNNLAQCFLTNPKLSRVPTPLPVTILSLFSPEGLDWTSPVFNKVFQNIIRLLAQPIDTN